MINPRIFAFPWFHCIAEMISKGVNLYFRIFIILWSDYMQVKSERLQSMCLEIPVYSGEIRLRCILSIVFFRSGRM